MNELSIVDIREATLEDADTILKMMEVFNEEEHITVTPEALREGYLALLENPAWGKVLLGEVGGVPASYAVLTYAFDFEFGGRQGVLTELFVSPRYRQRGVGNTMVGRVEEECRSLGLKALQLIVRPENAQAQVLYRRRDFRFDPRLPMTKRLG
jgi:ribosomal protein S18 acetylase RimI-like enzyme